MPHLLLISGSLRHVSANSSLLAAVAELVPAGTTTARYAGLAGLPAFNPDLEADGQVAPAAVATWRATLQAADAVLISSPEYAHGVPGALKNALDWAVGSGELAGKPVGLLNAAPRATHAQVSLLEILRTMDARLVPGACQAVPLAGRGLDAAGIVADGELRAQLLGALAARVVGLLVLPGGVAPQ